MSLFFSARVVPRVTGPSDGGIQPQLPDVTNSPAPVFMRLGAYQLLPITGHLHATDGHQRLEISVTS